MMEQENYKWMVCVRCSTYNQSKYIVEAMNGFTMQETNFPFVCIIIDDASTDGEQEVIKRYFKENFDIDKKAAICEEDKDDYVLSFAQHNTNRNCYFAVLFLKKNHYSIKKSKLQYLDGWLKKSKYCALCEGDDYWIATHKLQRQVNLLESDNDCSLCYHACKNIFEDNFKGEKTSLCESVMEKLTYESFIPGYPFQTASVVYRSSVYNSPLYKRVSSGGGMTSIILFITIGQFGCFRGINEQMSVYRRNAGGVSVKNKEKLFKSFLKKQISICGFFSHKVKKRFINKSIIPMLFNLFLKSRKDFLKMVIFSLKRHPTILLSLVCFFATIFFKIVSNKMFSSYVGIKSRLGCQF